MEFTQELYDVLMRHEQAIIRMSPLENVLMDIKFTLQEISMSNTNFAEKLAEMKASLSQISKDNLDQHKELSGRINEIEGKPGKKWESLVWLAVAAIVGGIITYLFTIILPVVK